MKTLSIVIPVRNEAGIVQDLLRRLKPYRERGHELIVIDGGSSDGTLELARGDADICESAALGRSLQMNRGAQRASGDVLLFLHADTQLPANADQLIQAALSAKDSAWGWFNVRLSGPGTALRLVAFMMNLRARLTRVCTGDQALFVERVLFEQIGGFPALPLMEDIAISKLLRRKGRPVRPAAHALTSSRRWEKQGVLSTVLLMWKLRFLYFLGSNPARLKELYYPHHE